MTKIEFLAASLPYGLKIMSIDNEVFTIHPYKDSIDMLSDNEHISIGNLIQENELAGKRNEADPHIPIIRHLDTLTQECVQADYNDGKPFIPIVELANMSFDFKNFKYIDGECVGSTGYEKVYFCLHKNGYFDSSYFKVKNQLQLFQHLLKWHFWPNKPEGEEVVYVTSEFNPYK